MKIAVTGATGFIGKWLLRDFGDRYQFIIIGRKKIEEDYIVFENRRYEYRVTDFSRESLKDVLVGIDGVIHLAAQRPSVNYKEEGFAVSMSNINLSLNLLDACIANDIKNIVFASSISNYSEENELPWKEDMLVQPWGYYGIGKVAVENICHFYNIRNKMNIKNLRIARVLGVGEREGFMLMNFINQASRKETLKLYGKGIGRREYIYVRDVASALISAIEKPEKSGIYNIGTNVNTSHKELAEVINIVFENEGNILLMEDKPEDTMQFLMDSSKAKNELHWEAKWELKEALLDMKQIMEKK